jgi:hypothetical protein
MDVMTVDMAAVRRMFAAERESIRRDVIREAIEAIDAEAALYVSDDVHRVMNLAVEAVRKLYERTQCQCFFCAPPWREERGQSRIVAR